jgi:hypothetical protein
MIVTCSDTIITFYLRPLEKCDNSYVRQGNTFILTHCINSPVLIALKQNVNVKNVIHFRYVLILSCFITFFRPVFIEHYYRYQLHVCEHKRLFYGCKKQHVAKCKLN